ncbi:hypothetical protein HG531_004707 [Fusarium graminearum]|nr:hypothetical protein HG531_004707 [Fusarium graminearum]
MLLITTPNTNRTCLAQADVITRAGLANNLNAAIPAEVASLISLALGIHLTKSVVDVSNVKVALAARSVDAVVDVNTSLVVTEVAGGAITLPVSASSSPVLQLDDGCVNTTVVELVAPAVGVTLLERSLCGSGKVEGLAGLHVSPRRNRRRC